MAWSDYGTWGATPPAGGAMITRRLRFPVSDVWTLAAVSGALVRLTDTDYLESIGANEPDEMAQIFYDMLEFFWGSEVSEIGVIKIRSTPENIPDNELICDGQQYTETEYTALYRAYKSERIFNAENGTFNVPDLRDKFVIGTSANRTTGDTGGAETVTLSIDELPEHNHEAGQLTVAKQDGAGSVSYAVASGIGGNVPIDYKDNIVNGKTASTGANQAHDNMPPFVALVYTVVAK
jgi:microcystin-dependent protein